MEKSQSPSKKVVINTYKSHATPQFIVTQSPLKANKETPIIQASPQKNTNSYQYNSKSPLKTQADQESYVSPQKQKQQKIQDSFAISQKKNSVNNTNQDNINKDKQLEQLTNTEIKNCKHQLCRTYEIHEKPFWFQKYCYECKFWFFYDPKNNEYKQIQGLVEPPVDDI